MARLKIILQRWRRSAIPTIKLADTVIVPSEYLLRVFDQFGLTTQVIYNLVDTGKLRFRDRIPLRPVFLANRNFEVHYGVDRVLRAFRIIQDKLPESKLDVVGDGSQRHALEALAQELGLRNTTFRGQIDPSLMPDVYDAADIYLNASEIDNQPLSIMEAFACGLPIVTTDAGGIPDMVSDGKTGRLIPRGDYVQMAERAIGLLKNESETRQMIERGRQECLKYSWEAVRDAWLGVYYKLADADASLECGDLSPL